MRRGSLGKAMITIVALLVAIGFSAQAATRAAATMGHSRKHSTPPPVPSTPPPTATTTPTSVPASTNTPVPTTTTSAIKNVFVIVEENHNWSSIYGSPSAPYINNTLLPQSSYATQYHNPPGLHPSEPNYLWLEAGTNCFSDTGCITDDNPPSSHATSSTSHLVTLLDNAGVSWKTYQENTTDGTCPLTDSYPYAVKHNPFAFFKNVTNSASYCASHERSYGDLMTDLTNNTVARYNFITPNLCDDGHDSCAPTNDPVKQTDSWLSTEVPKILNSAAYKSGGALFITWDEGEGSDGPIGMIVLSPFAKGHGYHNAISYTHSSTLRSIEEIFGVSPMLGNAATATDLADLFSTFP